MAQVCREYGQPAMARSHPRPADETRPAAARWYAHHALELTRIPGDQRGGGDHADGPAAVGQVHGAGRSRRVVVEAGRVTGRRVAGERAGVRHGVSNLIGIADLLGPVVARCIDHAARRHGVNLRADGERGIADERAAGHAACPINRPAGLRRRIRRKAGARPPYLERARMME